MKPLLSDPDLDDELREMLESASADEPDDARVDRLAGALGPLLDPPGGGGGGGGPEVMVPGSGGGASTWVVTAAVVGLAIAGFFWSQPLGSAGPAGRAPVPVPVPVPDPIHEPIHEPAPAPETEPIPPTPTPAPTPAPIPARTPEPAPNNLAAEAALIHSMRAALDGQPAQTLRLAQQHRRDHPRGDLAEERDVLVIEAHSRLGHDARVGRLGERFLSRNPGSTHSARVRSLLP